MKINRRKLIIAMAKASLSTADIAEKADIPISTIRNARLGRCTSTKVVGKIARALGVDVTEIIELEDFQ